MPQALIPIAGSVIGGLMSKKSGGGGQTQTASKEPWSAVQPWLMDQISQGQSLQKQYTEQPFSPLQQQAYSNLFNDLDNFRNNVAPGLLSWAGNNMQGGYQRQNASTPGTVGYGPRVPSQQPTQGIFGNAAPSTGAYAGLLSFAPPKAAATAPAQPLDLTNQEVFRKAMQEYQDQLNRDSGYRNWNTGDGA